MGVVSEEKKSGTLDLLLSHPIKIWELYLGKFTAALFLIILALLATLIFPAAISFFGEIGNSLDFGAILASYISLLLIVSAFISIGIFSSSLASNQISSFIISLTLSSILLIGLDRFADLVSVDFIWSSLKELSMINHLDDFSKGVFNSYDFLYFALLVLIFSLFSIFFIGKLDGEKVNRVELKRYLKIIISAWVIFIASSYWIVRFDFTDDKKYTLNPISFEIAESLNKNIDVTLLLVGDLPKGFKKLEKESLRIIRSLASVNSNIVYRHIDEGEFSSNKDFQGYLQNNGISPINLEINKGGEKKSKLVYPYILIRTQNKLTKVDLLKQQVGISPEQQLNNSLENLEYSISSSLEKVGNNFDKTIGILKGHGEIPNYKLADFINKFNENYSLKELYLSDSIQVHDLEKELKNIDLLFVASPDLEFSEKEKLLIDQYIVKGGSSLWLISGTSARMDTLYQKGRSIAVYQNNNLGDLFFKYGFRVNPDVVSDYRCSLIKLASGNIGSQVQYHSFPWPFNPVSIPDNSNPIVKNLQLVKFDFPSSIDTINNSDISKTILLKSSENTKLYGVPEVFEIRNPQRELDIDKFSSESKIFALLLEGKFTSAYKSRILPFRSLDYLEKADKSSKMIVVSDASFANSDYANNNYLAMGYDKWFNIEYGNGEFISNSVEYLTSNYPTLELRKKEIKLRLLSKKKIKEFKSMFEISILIYPFIYLLLFALSTIIYRRKSFKIR